MAKTAYANINAYHEAQPAVAQERMEIIRNMIHEIAPGVEESISYQIPCFKYQGYLIYYSAYARHLSLSYPFSKAFLQHFEKELKEYKVSRAAIQIPYNMPLPIVLIKDIITFRKEENMRSGS